MISAPIGVYGTLLKYSADQKTAKSFLEYFFNCQCNNQTKNVSDCRQNKWQNYLNNNFKPLDTLCGHWPLWKLAVLVLEGCRWSQLLGITQLCWWALSQGGTLCKRSCSAFLAADHMKIPFRCWWDKKKKKKIICMKITLSFTMQILEGKLVN